MLLLQQVIRKVRVTSLRVVYQHLPVGGPTFRCSICQFEGPFMATVYPARRPKAICPRCLSLERHRLQKLVCDKVFDEVWDPKGKTLLQFAPDAMTGYLRGKFSRVICADISPGKDRIVLDMRAIAMEDASVDAVFASHVMEHIREDATALREIVRVLKPGGIAILPVPIVSETTIEYPQPVAMEYYHWRAPGVDYFDRYRSMFGRVEVFSSWDFEQSYQTFAYEDRTTIDRSRYPYREPMAGSRHPDFVPVCFMN